MKKRFLALVLILAALASCLAACGGTEKNPETGKVENGKNDNVNNSDKQNTKYQRLEAETVTAKYAYRTEYMDLPVETDYISESCISGNNFYFIANMVNGKDSYTDPDTGEVFEYDTYGNVFFRMDLTTQELLEIKDVLPENENETDAEGWQYNSYVQGAAAGQNDSVWVSIQQNSYRYNAPEGVEPGTPEFYDSYETGEVATRILNVMPDGTIRTEFTIGAENNPEMSSDEMSNFYMGNFFVDSNDYIYASDYETVLVWDSEGTFIMKLDLDQYGDLTQYSADKVGVIEYGETRRLKTIDPVKKDFGETMELPSFAYNILPGDDVYDFYYENNNKIYGYIAETDTEEKVIDWLECDVDDRYMNTYSILSDGRVFALIQEWGNEGMPTTQIVMMERVEAEVLPQKQVLTLACMYLDYNIRAQVVKFNRQNQNYRIVVKDYSDYNTEDDYTAGMTKLSTEIASGVMPDLLDTSSMPVDQYAAKGLLCDLWSLIDGDSELSREDFITEVLDALSKDGKLYQLPISFTLSTVAGLEKTVGEYDTWTLDDLTDAMTKLKEDASIFSATTTRDSVLSQCVSQSFRDFVDWENGTCNFDCDEFKNLLEFAKKFPAEFDYSDYEYVSDYSRIRNGEQLLTMLSFYGFDDLYAQFKAMDDQPCFVGYPTSASGTPVRSTFSLGSSIAVTAACTDMDAAWAFLRSLLSDEHQSEIWSLPIMKSAFDAKLAKAMEQQFYTDPVTGELVEQSKGGIGYGDDEMIEIYAVTPEQRDIFMELLHSTTTIQSTDQNIMDIVTTEVGSFFAGEKSVDETAKLIQNRVNLYVMEQSN